MKGLRDSGTQVSGSLTNKKRISDLSEIFLNNSGSISKSLGKGLKTSVRVSTEIKDFKNNHKGLKHICIFLK